MNNVVEFPLANKKLARVTLGIALERLKRNEVNFVEEQVTEFEENLIAELQGYGLDFTNFQERADYSFLMNLIRAIFYRQHKLPHPLHKILNTARPHETDVDENGEPIIIFGPSDTIGIEVSEAPVKEADNDVA